MLSFSVRKNVFPMYNELFENNEKRVNTAILGSIGAGGIVYEVRADHISE